MFIVSLAFLTVFIFACSLTHLILCKLETFMLAIPFRVKILFFSIFAVAKATNQEFVEIIKMSPASVVIIFICFFSIWSVIGLAGFHTYLTTSDQTTNEDVSFYDIFDFISLPAIRQPKFKSQVRSVRGIEDDVMAFRKSYC